MLLATAQGRPHRVLPAQRTASAGTGWCRTQKALPQRSGAASEWGFAEVKRQRWPARPVVLSWTRLRVMAAHWREPAGGTNEPSGWWWAQKRLPLRSGSASAPLRSVLTRHCSPHHVVPWHECTVAAVGCCCSRGAGAGGSDAPSFASSRGNGDATRAANAATHSSVSSDDDSTTLRI